jgi:hypothetical protein
MRIRPSKPPPPARLPQDFTRTAERVLARHDFLSAGMGALAVTGYCVMRGQDLGTALWITAAATVGEYSSSSSSSSSRACCTLHPDCRCTRSSPL